MASLESPPPLAPAERVAWENPFARVRWSAVWAGLVAATGLQIVLAVLGAAVGISVMSSADRAGGVGLGAGIWVLVVLIISLFVGGMMAGRLAGVRTRFESLVHGALVWSLSLMLAAWLIGSTASHFLGGALSMAGNLTGSALTAAGALAGQAAGAVAANPGASQDELQRAADQVRREAEQRGITPDSARALAGNAAERARTAAGEVAGQVQGAATGGAWITLAAIVLAFFAAWLGAQWARPSRDQRAGAAI